MASSSVLYVPQDHVTSKQLSAAAARRARLIRLGAVSCVSAAPRDLVAVKPTAALPVDHLMAPISNDLFLAAWLIIDGGSRVIPDRLGVLDIQRAVALHFEIHLGEMISQRRTAHLVLPRQVAMYLAKKLTTRSLPEIGRHFKGRDHTTIIHAVRKIEKLMEIGNRVKSDIQIIVSALAPEKRGLFV